MAYRVVAGAVTVEMNIPGGRARQDVRAGAILPADVPQAEVTVLLGLGHIELVDEPAESEPEPGSDVVPDGTVVEVLEWVGEDLDRAASAVLAEQEKGDQARKGVLEPLSKLLSTELSA